MNKLTRFMVATLALLVGFFTACTVGASHGAVAGLITYGAFDLAVLHLVARPGTLYANSLGTLSTGLILVEALQQAIKTRPALSKVTLDWSAEPAKLNDAVRTQIIGAPTVNNFGTAAADRTDVDASVTLSAFKEIRQKFTASEISQTNRKLVAESAAPIAEAIGDYFMDLLGALWASATFTNTTTIATASFGYTTLTGLRTTLSADARAVPKKGRFGIVNGAVYENLLEDALCNRSTRGDGADPTATGELVGIAGFESIYEFPGLPSTNNVSGFFGHKSSTALVARTPRDPREVFNGSVPVNANMGVVSIADPNDPGGKGISVFAVEVIDPSLLTAEVIISWLAGAAVTREGFGQRTVTA